ncbi:hypothetical protein [Klebsiella aerogenes]|uniref:hypothetical protein n=1 Tax=Klebsiella aerogenes TaxID=548 RepID=UPI000DA165C5|nr:hypothetical protein [Klebsiella aerogenes]HCB2860436.1 hypothetical protein [Klebsiella aerogenes]HCB2864881.1 hypothetical protein [Klebsiella aerogenes]HCB2881526.1 hypothetical protein [Klebsiella aerogenes]HCB3346383.1 hypothetical protein [Klebsiella aerogenes]HCM1812504.1 hypothetical protein [Klebsiella aerogenes]
MRIDARLRRNGLTPRQLFFIECWGSLAHKESTDTDRVGFNNILNAINELLSLFPQGNKFKGQDKRKRAAQELLELLKEDVVLFDGRFENIPDQLKDMLDTKNAWSDKERSPVEKHQGLMESLFTQLKLTLEAYYLPASLERLEAELNKEDPPSDSDYACITSLCNNIMSFLLTLGMPLTECSLLYSRTLMKYRLAFDVRFRSWAEKVNVRAQRYTVSIVMENEKLHDMLQQGGENILFNGCQYSHFISDKGVPSARAEIEVQAVSVLAARVKADFVLKDSLDVVAYMLGRGQINTHSAFQVRDESGIETHISGFSNEILTNSDRLTMSEFGHFMSAITGLFTKASPESARKVSSAFHFLRNGLINKTTQENQFTSFWSALEALTLDVSSRQLDHDEHVVYTTPPCMGLDYVVKQLISLRGIAKQLGLTLMLQDGQRVIPGDASLDEIYMYLKDGEFVRQFCYALSDYPYAAYMLRKFTALCAQPRELGRKIIRHAEKVELHIYRLYILRNAIVHNAESNPYIQFLTVNLEHYLRGTINAMFYTASMLPVIRSPEEAFQRYIHMYERLVNELEPTFGIAPGEHRSVESSIGQNRIIPSDTGLIEWLKLHK